MTQKAYADPNLVPKGAPILGVDIEISLQDGLFLSLALKDPEKPEDGYCWYLMHPAVGLGGNDSVKGQVIDSSAAIALLMALQQDILEIAFFCGEPEDES